MTPQKAIDIIDDVSWEDNGRHYGKIVPARNLAKSALEKQIPKKVDEYKVFEDGAFYNIDFMCPACGYVVIGQPYEPDFCKHCGQALDWSETE